MYGMLYWGFVHLAKEAKATYKLRKTAIVDTKILDDYIANTPGVAERAEIKRRNADGISKKETD